VSNLTWNNSTLPNNIKIPAPPNLVQQNLLPIPDELPDELAAMTEPLTIVP